MAVRYQTRGLALKKEVRGEADQIFTFYTEDFGKIKILGKSIRKIKSKLKGGIKLFSLSDIEFIQGKIYKTLTDAVVIKNFKNTRENLEKFEIACQIIKITDDLIKREEKDKEIWDLLRDVFGRLNDCSLLAARCSLIYYYFFWNLLSILGYQINLYKCAFCGKKLIPQQIYLEPGGGIICFNCFGRVKKGSKISPEIIKIIRLFLKKDWQTILKLKITNNYEKLLRSISEEYLKV